MVELKWRPIYYQLGRSEFVEKRVCGRDADFGKESRANRLAVAVSQPVYICVFLFFFLGWCCV